MLVRDVTEVKRRDRALLSKDATIREIHHRVKNNLQTVAALLRLQARRTDNTQGREALLESVRRVAAIAQVHEALSISVDEEVNLDDVVDRILPIMNDVARVDAPIRISREGALGVLDADRATALVMVVTELVQNAIEHAFGPADKGGQVVIRADRSARALDIVVSDDGRGLPEGSAWRNRPARPSDRADPAGRRTGRHAGYAGAARWRHRRCAAGSDRAPNRPGTAHQSPHQKPLAGVAAGSTTYPAGHVTACPAVR